MAAGLALLGAGCAKLNSPQEAILPPAHAAEATYNQTDFASGPVDGSEPETETSLETWPEPSSSAGRKVKVGTTMDPLSYDLGDTGVLVTRTIVNLDDYFTTESLYEQAKRCGYPLKSDHMFHETLYFLPDKRGYRYEFQLPDPDGEYQGSHKYVLTIFPHFRVTRMHNMEEFLKRFNVCEPGSEVYPLAIDPNWLLFESSCIDGYTTDGSGRAIGCDVIRDQVLETLTYN